MGSVTVGIDWAEGHHDVAVMDETGSVVGKARIDTGVAGVTELLALIAEHGGSPEQSPVGIETDKNLLVVALVAAGFTVYPLNPRAVARYRERHSQSGRKSDARDAALLADVLRTDRHLHRPMPAISEQGLALEGVGASAPGSDLGMARRPQPSAIAAPGVLPPGTCGLP